MIPKHKPLKSDKILCIPDLSSFAPIKISNVETSKTPKDLPGNAQEILSTSSFYPYDSKKINDDSESIYDFVPYNEASDIETVIHLEEITVDDISITSTSTDTEVTFSPEPEELPSLIEKEIVDLPSPPRCIPHGVEHKSFKSKEEQRYVSEGYHIVRTFSLENTHHFVQMISPFGDFFFMKFETFVEMGDEEVTKIPLASPEVTAKGVSDNFKNLIMAPGMITIFSDGIIFDSKIYSSKTDITELDIITPYIYPFFYNVNVNFKTLGIDVRYVVACLEKDIKKELKARKESVINRLYGMIEEVERHYNNMSIVDADRADEANHLYEKFDSQNKIGDTIPTLNDFAKIKNLSEIFIRYSTSHLSLWTGLKGKINDSMDFFEKTYKVVYEQMRIDFPDINF